MFRKFIAVFALMFLVSSTAFAEEYLEAEGCYYLEAEGYSCLDNYDQKDPMYKNLARQIARMDALTYLTDTVTLSAEILTEGQKQLEFQITGTKRSFILHDSEAFKFVSKNARQTGNAKFCFDDEGNLICKVTMRIAVTDKDLKKLQK